MLEPIDHHEFESVEDAEALAEQGSSLTELIRRVILGFLALLVIFSLLSNLLALPQTANTASRSDIGLTEAEIITRYGPPDERSQVRAVGRSEPIGLAPRRLDQGDKYFSLRYEEGPLSLVFHFVSPDTFQKYNAYRIDDSQWVVLERFVGARSVIY